MKKSTIVFGMTIATLTLAHAQEVPAVVPLVGYGMSVFDSKGRFVGFSEASNLVRMYYGRQWLEVGIIPETATIIQSYGAGVPYYFTSGGCSGTPYLPAEQTLPVQTVFSLNGNNPGVYYPASPFKNISAQSYALSPPSCTPISPPQTMLAGVATKINFPVFTPPFVLK
jgi:hypothetical protein